MHLLVHSAHLLPDWYDDWVVDERERLGELRVLALELAADELIGAGAYCDAALLAKAAVRADPLRESATRLLIRLHLATGNPGEAVRRTGRSPPGCPTTSSSTPARSSSAARRPHMTNRATRAFRPYTSPSKMSRR